MALSRSPGLGRSTGTASSLASSYDETPSSLSSSLGPGSPLSGSGPGNLGSLKNRGMMMNKLSTRFYGKSTTHEIKEDLLPASSKIANFANRKMGDAGLHDVCEILKMNRVTEMSLSNNNLTEEGMSNLLRGLDHNTSITSFDLSHNHIRDTGFEMLAQAFQTSSSLTCLNLSDNGITRLSGPSLVELLKIPTLQTLDLSNNIIYEEGAQHLAEGLADSSLTYLNLSCCRLGDKGVKSLMSAVKSCTTLKHIIFSENDITADGARLVLEGVLRASVSHLDLALNPTGDEISGDLIETLLSNKLTYLNIGGMDLGAGAISAVSSNLGNLQSLILRSNNLDESAVETLMAAVRGSISLTHLSLRSCLEGNILECIRFISEALEDSPLEFLELQVNGLDDRCASVLAQGILKGMTNRSGTSALRQLDLSFNDIGDAGFQSLLPTLKGFTDGSVLRLDHCLVTDAGAENLLSFLSTQDYDVDVSLENCSIGAEVMRKLSDHRIVRERKKRASNPRSSSNTSSLHSPATALARLQQLSPRPSLGHDPEHEHEHHND